MFTKNISKSRENYSHQRNILIKFTLFKKKGIQILTNKFRIQSEKSFISIQQIVLSTSFSEFEVKTSLEQI